MKYYRHRDGFQNDILHVEVDDSKNELWVVYGDGRRELSPYYDASDVKRWASSGWYIEFQPTNALLHILEGELENVETALEMASDHETYYHAYTQRLLGSKETLEKLIRKVKK